MTGKQLLLDETFFSLQHSDEEDLNFQTQPLHGSQNQVEGGEKDEPSDEESDLERFSDPEGEESDDEQLIVEEMRDLQLDDMEIPIVVLDGQDRKYFSSSKVVIPKSVSSRLRDYQKEGVSLLRRSTFPPLRPPLSTFLCFQY